MKTVAALLLAVASVFVAGYLNAQGPSPAGQDDLVDHLTGTWKLTGAVMCREAHHTVTAEWVLNHQFLRIHEETADDAPESERRYEAIWFLGYDATSERYVLHLLDIFGARYETLGYGTRDGNAIRFVFEYPDGPFHTIYRWSPEEHGWQWLLEQKDKDGKWSTSPISSLPVLPAPKPGRRQRLEGYDSAQVFWS